MNFLLSSALLFNLVITQNKDNTVDPSPPLCYSENSILKNKDRWRIDNFYGHVLSGSLVLIVYYEVNKDVSVTVESIGSPPSNSASWLSVDNYGSKTVAIRIVTDKETFLYRRASQFQDGIPFLTNCFNLTRINKPLFVPFDYTP